MAAFVNATRTDVAGAAIRMALAGSMVIAAVFSAGAAAAQVVPAPKERRAQPVAPKPARVRPKKPVGQAAGPAARANPLQKMLKQLFGGRRAIGKPGGAKDHGDDVRPDGSERDSVDYRAPHDKTASGRLRRAGSLIERQKWRDAYRLLQTLLARPEDSLFFSDQGQWRSVRLEALRLLQSFPQEAQRWLRDAHEAGGRRALAEAERSGRLGPLAEVALRYFNTSAGRTAADQLATRHLDRGEFVAAAFWFERLLRPSDSEPDAHLARQAKAALAFFGAGRRELARRVIDRLHAQHRGTAVRLGTQQVAIDEAWLR
ncbi:MAG TPA: hypothetical protein EYP14_18100, partial [Planctomycetaceae bacterium]|nr:hypothetical protein [Planctomycetaceae bacterium]